MANFVFRKPSGGSAFRGDATFRGFVAVIVPIVFAFPGDPGTSAILLASITSAQLEDSATCADVDKSRTKAELMKSKTLLDLD
jgi:hypothetical protein